MQQEIFHINWYLILEKIRWRFELLEEVMFQLAFSNTKTIYFTGRSIFELFRNSCNINRQRISKTS